MQKAGALGLALVLLLAAGAPRPAAAEDLEMRARDLVARYAKLRDAEGERDARRRHVLLRQLGELDTPLARQTLLDVFRQPRNLGDRLVALRTIGPILDAPSATEIAQLVGRRPDPVFLQTLAEALATAQRPDAHAWLAGEGLEQKQADVFRACLDALGTLALPAARDHLVRIYTTNEAKRSKVDLAYGALRALGRIGGPEVRPHLRHAARHGDARLRLAAADVLARQDGLEAEDRALVRALLQDEDAIVQRAAAVAVGESMDRWLVGSVIPLLGAPRLRTRSVAHDVLVKIGGRDLGWRPGPWIRWIERTEEPETRGGARSYAFGTYYGFDVDTDRVVFLVDMSGSMAWPWREGQLKRYVAARKELTRTLEGLSPGTRFNVLVFSDRVRAWKRSEQKADERTVPAALRWLERALQDPEGNTNTYGVLERAFAENPEADTFFLLSDGAPNGGTYDVPEAILASVRHWNRYRRVAIHTIALTLPDRERARPHLVEDLAAMERFMKGLAGATGGRYQLVEDVPEWMHGD